MLRRLCHYVTNESTQASVADVIRAACGRCESSDRCAFVSLDQVGGMKRSIVKPVVARPAGNR
ncbi:MAG: hypothetical protein AAF958_07530 [Planctomycetota bacterium]